MTVQKKRGRVLFLSQCPAETSFRELTVLSLSHFDIVICLECLLSRKSLKSSGAISCYLIAPLTNKKCQVRARFGAPSGPVQLSDN